MSTENSVKLTIPVEGSDDKIELEFELKELADLIVESLSLREINVFEVCLAFAKCEKTEKAYEEYTGKKFTFNAEEK